jgi:hypothetical protein
MTDITLNAPSLRSAQALSVPSIQGLDLAVGQLLRATVQRVSEAALWLDVGGRTLVAHSELPLQAGQRLSLTVESVDPSRVILRMAAPTEAATTGEAGQSLESLLLAWDLEPDSLNMEIARSLLARRLSVDPDAIRFIHRQFQILSMDASASAQTGETVFAEQPLSPAQQADVEALVHLFVKEIPITKESLELARLWQKGPQPTAPQFQQLQTSVEQVVSQLNALPREMAQLSALRGALERAMPVIAEWATAMDMPVEQMAARLESFVPRWSTPLEAALGNLLLSVGSGEAPPAMSSVDVVQVSGFQAATAPPLPAEAVVDALRDQPQKVLHDLLSSVEEALDKHVLSEPVSRSVRELGEHLRTITQDLVSAQLGNTGSSSVLVESSYVFPIPVMTPEGPQTAFLKVYRNPEQTRTDPDNVRLALLFDLPELGEIAVDLMVSDRQVNGQVLSGRQETHDLVAEELGKLQSRLSELGYAVGALSCNMLSAARGNATSAVGSGAGALTAKRVDLTV